MTILLGPAGTPAKTTIDGLPRLRELGLQAMEVQFSHGIGMGLDLARKIGEENKKFNISLSVHAPFFINLASADRKKAEESRKRIIDSCERAALMGAPADGRQLLDVAKQHHSDSRHTVVVFHPGFYTLGDRSFDAIEEAISDIKSHIDNKKWAVELAPETTGKVNQFGQLDELEKIVKKVGCGMCVDFAHIYARNHGKINYGEVLGWLKKLGIKHIHSHFSGINFGEKGERSHLVMGKPGFEPLAREILKRKLDITIISESPVTWKDSLRMKGIFEKLGYEF